MNSNIATNIYDLIGIIIIFGTMLILLFTWYKSELIKELKQKTKLNALLVDQNYGYQNNINQTQELLEIEKEVNVNITRKLEIIETAYEHVNIIIRQYLNNKEKNS